MLVGCKVALTQGRFRWSLDQVLSKLAEVLKSSRVAANYAPTVAMPALTGFVKPGSTPQQTIQKTNTTLTPGKEWQMRVDFKKQLVLPKEILITSVHPETVLWLSVEKRVLLIELTIPWEEGMTAAHERKYLKYTELAAKCREAEWAARILPMEVGCRGFVGRSAVSLLRDVGVAGAKLQRTVKDLGEEVGQSSYWLWFWSKDSRWCSAPP